MLLVAHSKISQNAIWHESLKMYCVCPHLAWRFSISRSLSRWSLFRASLCLRVCVSKFSSAYSSCSFSCSSRAFARWTRVRFSCRRRACCSSLSEESFSSSHTRFSNSNTCGTDTSLRSSCKSTRAFTKHLLCPCHVVCYNQMRTKTELNWVALWVNSVMFFFFLFVLNLI